MAYDDECLDIESYKCKECNKSFQKNDDLKLHVDGAHQKVKPYQCTNCEISFNTKEKFEKHMIEIHQSLPFPCEYCVCSFAQKNGFKSHDGYFQEPEEKIF